MEKMDQEMLRKVAQAMRSLSLMQVQGANSGHPGLPLGCADLMAYLYGYLMRYNPKDPKWANRDRFVLSAGHGSALLYSALHLAGYDVTMDDLKGFRQAGSKTPGHPEVGHTAGVEATTGPLGQGLSFAVGMALAGKMAAARLNSEDEEVIDYKVFCLAGDGCFMEGISHEALSYAGHVGLNNLVVIYDYNNVTLDGLLPESCSDDVERRFLGHGFDVYDCDGMDFKDINRVFTRVKEKQTKPVLIIARTLIGYGSSLAGTNKVHGSPFKADELAEVKRTLGLPDDLGEVPADVMAFFKKRLAEEEGMQRAWEEKLKLWKQTHPKQATLFDEMMTKPIPASLPESLKKLQSNQPIAGRSASGMCIQEVAKALPYFVGGSADLSGSDSSAIKEGGYVNTRHFEGKNIKYGVREFAMSGISAGLWLSGFFRSMVGTFFTFSDYMRNSIRLTALSQIPTIYQFTHESIFLGEDGPTHQPVEHLASLRAMPNLFVMRPADLWETAGLWMVALQRTTGPSAFALSRQTIPQSECTRRIPWEAGVYRGGYIVRKEKGKPDFSLIATGSELALALDVADELEKQGKNVRVISMPCWELFEEQSASYIDDVVGGDIGKRVSIEAASSFGWSKWVGPLGLSIAVDRFGASAPLAAIREEYGFTVEKILERIL